VILLTTSDLPDDVHRIADGSFCIAPSKHPWFARTRCL
jgi:hypothetical protein